MQPTTRLHLIYFVAFLIFLLVAWWLFATWKTEHDARMLAGLQIKTSEAAILRLEDRIEELMKLAEQKKTIIIRQVQAVKTPEQAVIAIPTLSLTDLYPRLVPSLPDAVAVNAVALTGELGKCAQDRIDLGACKEAYVLKDDQLTEKDKEIKALKVKPSFWKRLASGAKKVGIGIAIGLGIAGAAAI